MAVKRQSVSLTGLGALVAFMLLLAGCSALLDTGTRRREDVLSQSSYGAADMLIQQSRSVVSPDTRLEIGVLTDLDSPNEQTNFGRMVAEQIASRFVQLGYNVAAAPGTGAPPMQPVTDGYMSQPSPQYGGGTGPSIITGTYAVARERVLVNLRIVEAAGGKVVAAYDYHVPLTGDVRELVKTSADKASFFDF